MAEGSVRKLDTKSFSDAISSYGGHIQTYESIVNGVNNSISTLLSNWKGKGRDAFENDSKQVQLNLKDISDIMYDMRDALIKAHAEYMKTDSAVAKNYDSAETNSSK